MVPWTSRGEGATWTRVKQVTRNSARNHTGREGRRVWRLPRAFASGAAEAAPEPLEGLVEKRDRLLRPKPTGLWNQGNLDTGAWTQLPVLGFSTSSEMR
jgi:hypothetical protein